MNLYVAWYRLMVISRFKFYNFLFIEIERMESAISFRLMLGSGKCFLSAEVLRLSAKSDFLVYNRLLIGFLFINRLLIGFPFINCLLKPILMEESESRSFP